LLGLAVEEGLVPVAVVVEFELGREPATEVLLEELMMLELPVPTGTERVDDSLSLEELVELLLTAKGAREASWRRYATLAEARLESDSAATAAEMNEGIMIVVRCCY